MYELRVLTGLHQGAALPLVGEQWAIGAEDSRDLALHDPGIASLHCRLQRVDDGWQLLAEEGAVLDEEGHSLASTQVLPGSRFVLGSVWVCLAAADSPWPIQALPVEYERGAADTASAAEAGGRGPSRLFNRSLAIALGVLLGVMGSAWSLSWPTASGDRAVSAAAPPSDAVTVSTDGRTPLQVDEALDVLKRMLSERLLNDVSVARSEQGVTLSGSLQGEGLLIYERMLKQFQAQYRTRFTLDDQVSNGAAGLPFVIVQIIAGSSGHLVMEDGRRLHVGDTLDGLRLVRIDQQRIVFDGARRYEVAW